MISGLPREATGKRFRVCPDCEVNRMGLLLRASEFYESINILKHPKGPQPALGE
jgi:hypothetical protein